MIGVEFMSKRTLLEWSDDIALLQQFGPDTSQRDGSNATGDGPESAVVDLTIAQEQAA